jgi:KUP system potassium uptake protein
MSSTVHVEGEPRRTKLFGLALGSVGVVYGDIGTSPLYALKESLKAATAGGTADTATVIGVVSLVLWTLIVIVTLKYVLLIMRADNQGEGGILALTALAARGVGPLPVIVGLGMVGAALFYGDAVLTPAVSVLSAVEGLKLVAPSLDHYVLPIAITVLVALFSVQFRGTAKVASFFGPIMALWFAILALAALPHIVAQPAILAAINPLEGVRFLTQHLGAAFITLGAVFLSVTGAEALYADMGHFGRKAIRIAWMAFVFPALALNYLGQGALILAHPDKAENPFFLLFPDWALLPMVILATAATVIASQAVISGAFSLTQQASLLRLLPRMTIRQTSETEAGQIYIPRINWMLLLVVIPLVVVFKTSEALAAAYGIAVTGTMVVTALLAFVVAWKVWGWNPVLAGAVVVPLLAIDIVFLASNALKVLEGGWLPLLFGAGVILCMVTWRRGMSILSAKERRTQLPIDEFLTMIATSSAARVEGTAVFLTTHANEVPPALMHNLKHNRVLHQQNVLLHVHYQPVPRVPLNERAVVEPLADGWTRITLRFGFMEVPNVPKALPVCRKLGLKFDVMKTSFFLSRLSLRASPTSGMPLWQDRLFLALAALKNDASEHFHIPTSRSIEIGTQVTI